MRFTPYEKYLKKSAKMRVIILTLFGLNGKTKPFEGGFLRSYLFSKKCI